MTMNKQFEEDLAFVLHTYPYSETSLIVEVLTRNHGRLGLLAKGAKRPRSPMRGVLLAFQPLLIKWFGKAELRTLARAEWRAALPQLPGTGLLCGFYLNELLLKLTRRDDAHEALFDFYAATMMELRTAPASGNASDQYGGLLRRFEFRLLKELGYAVSLAHDVQSGESIEASRYYEYLVERGPVAARPGSTRLLRGQTLLDMLRGEYTDADTAQEAKHLMRSLLNYYLGGQPLYTRQLIRDLREMDLNDATHTEKSKIVRP